MNLKNKRVKVVLFIFAGFLFVYGIVFLADMNDQISDNQDEIGELRYQIDDLDSKIDDVDGKIDDHKYYDH